MLVNQELVVQKMEMLKWMCEQLSILRQGMSDSRDRQNKESETEINLSMCKIPQWASEVWDVDNIERHKW